ncbi:MAG: hypothetical protein MSS98_07905 [Alphaproteobacteria bacterium]|nr:hypothetical protein [Alphaproteobacteria bacterium]MDY4690439.1 hypothetical protein [Alphaproteobacteria bacterium]
MFNGIEFFRGKSWGKGVGLLPSVRNDVCSVGRSMIEMLGVLAIIAVLTVGGIAGYSKAMEKFKVNKAISEYSYLIQGLMEHLTEIQKMSNIQEGDVHHGLINVVQATNLVPETWKNAGNQADDKMIDPYGNVIQIFSRYERLVIDMYLGGYSDLDDGTQASLSFSPKFCSALMQDVVQPLSSVLYYAWFTNGNYYFYGDKHCRSGSKCIRDLKLSDINRACNYCTKQSGRFCGLILEF